MAAPAQAGNVVAFPLTRKPVPKSRWRTVRAAVEAGVVADADSIIRERRRAAYDAKRAREDAFDFAARMVENLAYCLPEESKAKFKELAKLSVETGHSPDYKRAAAKLLQWL